MAPNLTKAFTGLVTNFICSGHYMLTSNVGCVCRSNELLELPESELAHPARALAYDAQGRWFMAAGDDKAVKVWGLASKTLHCQWCAALLQN